MIVSKEKIIGKYVMGEALYCDENNKPYIHAGILEGIDGYRVKLKDCRVLRLLPPEHDETYENMVCIGELEKCEFDSLVISSLSDTAEKGIREALVLKDSEED